MGLGRKGARQFFYNFTFSPLTGGGKYDILYASNGGVGFVGEC